MASIPVDVRLAFPQSSSIPILKRTSLWSHGPGAQHRRLLPRDSELVHGKSVAPQRQDVWCCGLTFTSDVFFRYSRLESWLSLRAECLICRYALKSYRAPVLHSSWRA